MAGWRKRRHARTNKGNCASVQSPIQYLVSWRPRRDLDPCYRRERASEGACSSLHVFSGVWINPGRPKG